MAGAHKLGKNTGMKPEEIFRLFNGLSKLIIKDGKVSIKDFGTFKMLKRAGNPIINPNDGMSVDVKDYNIVTFSAHPKLKREANK